MPLFVKYVHVKYLNKHKYLVPQQQTSVYSSKENKISFSEQEAMYYGGLIPFSCPLIYAACCICIEGIALCNQYGRTKKRKVNTAQ